MIPWLKNLQKLKNLLSLRRKQEPKWVDEIQDLSDENNAWWGSFTIEEEQSRYFKIGNVILHLDRYSQEWQITTQREGQSPHTFAAQAHNTIGLKPALPDRALLTQLERPFYIARRETLLLYISIPVWISLEAGFPPILLEEIPTEILADTWFGKNTLEGDLCYTGSAQCSSKLEDLSRDNTHVIAPVSITNLSKDRLYLQELKLPLPYLSIYSDSQNTLWTEQLNITHENPGHMEIIHAKGPPKALNDIQLVNTPRLGLRPGLKNIFSSFLWR